MGGWTDRRTDGRTGGGSVGWTDGSVGWMVAWTDGRRTDGRMDGGMHEHRTVGRTSDRRMGTLQKKKEETGAGQGAHPYTDVA